MSHIEKAKHCLLCENQIIDYHKGTLCGLSNEKPHFNERCHEANFKEKFENKIIQLNANYQDLKKSNLTILFYSISYFILGLVVIYGAYQLGRFVLGKDAIRVVTVAPPIIIAAAGIFLILKSIASSVNHYNHYAVAKNYKTELDQLLQLYSISYDLSLTFGKEIHGEKRFVHDLKIIKN